MADPKPYLIKQDDTVVHREAGHVVGFVRFTDGHGWRGLDIEMVPLPTNHPYGRKYAARAVWQAYQKRVDCG